MLRNLRDSYVIIVGFLRQRVLGAHGGAGYTFGALAILVVPTGNTPVVTSCARSVPVTAFATPTPPPQGQLAQPIASLALPEHLSCAARAPQLRCQALELGRAAV